MDHDKETVSRRVIVNIMTREHRSRVNLRVSAAARLAAKEASFAVHKAHLEKEMAGELGFGPNYSDDEREIKYLKDQLDLATHNEAVTAEAMEYVTLYFLDQLDVEKAKAET
jgi:hypothetical protein